jgi:hypothetical protein
MMLAADEVQPFVLSHADPTKQTLQATRMSAAAAAQLLHSCWLLPGSVCKTTTELMQPLLLLLLLLLPQLRLMPCAMCALCCCWLCCCMPIHNNCAARSLLRGC